MSSEGKPSLRKTKKSISPYQPQGPSGIVSNEGDSVTTILPASTPSTHGGKRGKKTQKKRVRVCFSKKGKKTRCKYMKLSLPKRR